MTPSPLLSPRPNGKAQPADNVPTGLLAAGGLVAGFGVAVVTGSRPLGGAVLLAAGLVCARSWNARHGRRTALLLAGADLLAFVASHGLARVIGAWPSVIAVSVVMGGLAWAVSDSRRSRTARPRTGSAVAAPPVRAG